MSERNKSEILSEIKQITEQYKAEVPSGRRAWPNAIKDRVRELKCINLSDFEISRLTGISAQTIWSWKLGKEKSLFALTTLPQASSFKPVAVKNPSTVKVERSTPIKKCRQKKISTVTVVTPNGYRIEGLASSELSDLFLKLEIRK